MDAKTFLSGLASPLAEGEAGATIRKNDSQRSGASPDVSPSASGASEPVSEQDSPLVFSDTTPFGIVVEYEPQPRRLYRVNGVEVPSVTTVLDVLSKDGLKFWGQDVGVRAILELFVRGRLATVVDWKDDSQAPVIVNGLEHEAATFDSLKKLITAEKLSCNHVLNKAADRGTNVHDALEQWAKSSGEFYPTLQAFPEEERGYVDGLLKWIDEFNTQATSLAMRPALCEVMVGSQEHGFAGRYDLVIETQEPVTLIKRKYKRKESLVTYVAPGRYMVDLKTPKSVYPTSHFRQLAAYELASVECGYPKTNGQFVLHVTSEGFYEFVPSNARAEDFLAVLRVWQSNQKLQGK